MGTADFSYINMKAFLMCFAACALQLSSEIKKNNKLMFCTAVLLSELSQVQNKRGICYQR